MAWKNKEYMYSYQKKRWKERKLRAIEYKGGTCAICGGSFPPPAMQFHHRDPGDKEHVWTTLRQMSWDKVLTELDKCDLVCSNCHSVIHSSVE